MCGCISKNPYREPQAQVGNTCGNCYFLGHFGDETKTSCGFYGHHFQASNPACSRWAKEEPICESCIHFVHTGSIPRYACAATKERVDPKAIPCRLWEQNHRMKP